MTTIKTFNVNIEVNISLECVEIENENIPLNDLPGGLYAKIRDEHLGNLEYIAGEAGPLEEFVQQEYLDAVRTVLSGKRINPVDFKVKSRFTRDDTRGSFVFTYDEAIVDDSQLKELISEAKTALSSALNLSFAEGEMNSRETWGTVHYVDTRSELAEELPVDYCMSTISKVS